MTMTRRVLQNLIILTLLLVVGGLAGATESSKPSKPPTNPPAIPNVPVSPRALGILGGACEVFSSAKAFTYHAEINFDSVLPSYVKLQFAAEMDVAIQRPDHLAVSYASDLGGKRVWYDGKSVTVLDLAHMTYATVAAPATIDQMLVQFAREKTCPFLWKDSISASPASESAPT